MVTSYRVFCFFYVLLAIVLSSFFQKKEESTLSTLGQHPRELNPYWKDGGSGLPSSSSPSHKRVKSEGRSWILRSYKRALEQANEKNTSFEEIAQKQWGSVEKIHSLLRSVGIDPKDPDSHLPGNRKQYLYSRSKYDEGKPSTSRSHRQNRSIDRSQNPQNPRLSMESKSFLCPSEDFSMSVDDVNSNKSSWKRHHHTGNDAKEKREEARFEKERTPPPVVACDEREPQDDCVTDNMINSTSAKLIKAELTGNKRKIDKLKEELQSLRAKKESQDQSKVGEPSRTSREKTVLLTTTDKFGRVRPADMPSRSERLPPSRGKGTKSYSAGEDYSMRALLEMEHKMTAEDTHLAIAKMASKFVRSTDDDVVDDVMDIKVKTNLLKEEERQRNVIKLESRRMEKILENCQFCVNSSCNKPHLMVAMGLNTYLAVPQCQSLTEGHCIITPIEHTVCSLQMDENVWSEVKIFQKGLTKMFADHDKDVVFSECFCNPGRKAHMYIDCIPLAKNEGSLAPMYFKKAILESDSEWAQNRRLIDTRQKGLRSSVPLGLPYFSVDFNNEGGFAHVIEDSSLFPHYFAKEVVGGLIDTDPVLWLKPPRETRESQVQKTAQIKEMWSHYDWTKQLKE